jgi:hypothetical protein
MRHIPATAMQGRVAAGTNANRGRGVIFRGLATILYLLATATAGMIASHAQARYCKDDTLQNKSEDGSILIMMSGAVYEVLAGDDIDSELWLPPEEVLICDAPVLYQGRTVMLYEIINTDEGEKVGAQRLR